jgi:predicted amidohydrolase
MAKFNIAIAQYPLTRFKRFENWQAHTASWCQAAANSESKLLVFPEYGSMELVSLLQGHKTLSLSQQLMGLQTLLPDFKETYASLAKKLKVDILAPSFPVLVKNKFINRAFLFKRNGQTSYQDKIKMTRFEDEIWGISPGENVLRIFDLGYAKIAVSICFDSEFPVFASLLAHKGCEVLLAPSCTETLWGHHRVHVGSRARALENQFYVAVSPIVKDAKWCEALDKNVGRAAVYGPSDLGFPADGVVAQGALNKPQWLYSSLDTSLISQVRNLGGVFNFKNSQEMKLLMKKFQVKTVR